MAVLFNTRDELAAWAAKTACDAGADRYAQLRAVKAIARVTKKNSHLFPNQPEQ